MRFTKDELRAYAVHGARERVVEIERELDRLQLEFPELFAGRERPLLLAAEKRPPAGSNGHGGPRPSATRSASLAAKWTPARRKKQAAIMRTRMKGKYASRATAIGAKRQAGRKGWQQKWYDRLVAHGPERLSVSAKALGAATASMLTSSAAFRREGKIVKRADGRYEAGTAPAQP